MALINSLRMSLESTNIVLRKSWDLSYCVLAGKHVFYAISILTLLCSTHNGSVHYSCGSTSHQSCFSLFCWECVLCCTHYHFVLILPSQLNQLHHTLWVCTRIWTVFYLQHHYSVLARWPYSWYKYHSCKCSWVDPAWWIFLKQSTNSGMQWASWPQLLKYGGLTNMFFSFNLLQ